MRLLDRYVLRELFRWLGLSLAGLLILWLAGDVIGNTDDFQDARMSVLDVAEYYLYEVPLMVGEILAPLSLLVATLLTLTRFSRHNELVAMRSFGCGIFRICLPIFLVGVLFAGLVFWVNEGLAPRASLAAAQIRQRHLEGEGARLAGGRLVRDFDFSNDSAGRLWKIGTYDLELGRMTNVLVQAAWPGDRVRYLKAARAEYLAGHWVFHDTLERMTGRRNEDFTTQRHEAALPVPEFTESPELIKSEYEISSLTGRRASKGAVVSLATLRHYFSLHPQLPPYKQRLLATQFHARLAEPLTSLVVVLIAIPFAVPTGRRNVFIGVAAALFIAFGYFILLRLGLTLGVGGQLAPWLAAWLPNLCFATAGLFLLYRVR